MFWEGVRTRARAPPAQLEAAAAAALEFGALDKNHAVVMRVPGLLRRLLRTLEVANTTPVPTAALAVLLESFGPDVGQILSPELLSTLVGARPGDQWGARCGGRGRAGGGG